MKNASFKTLLDDLRISFKFALKNTISYILAIIGVIIVTGILIGLVAILVFVPAMFLSGGFEAFVLLMENLGLALTEPGTTIIVGMVFLFAPLIAPFFVAIGALFGMGREIVESEGTTASGVFTWYKRKFFPLAGAGLVLFFVVVGPFLLTLLLGALVFGDAFFNFAIFSTAIYNPVWPVSMAILTLWIVISTGLLSMIFPAVIDGASVIEATKKSVRMSIRYFDRVFGFWIGYLLVLVAFLSPVILGGILLDFSSLISWAIMGYYAIPMFLIIIFVAIPAMSIGLTRVYLILTADDEVSSADSEDDSSISFVGGF